MKLQQLRYIVEVVNRQLNISAAAEALFTSQPGISKQIKLLEQELGVPIFIRSGKSLSGLTPAGEQIVQLAKAVLNQTQTIKLVATEFVQPNAGQLNLATTYMQTRYALPPVLQQFVQQYPQIELHLEQCQTQQAIEHLQQGHSTLAIISQLPSKLDSELMALPCYHWNYVLLTPKQHPLAQHPQITLPQLLDYPLICYDFSDDGRDLQPIFAKTNLPVNMVFNTVDTELIKTYVRMNMGVGIVAKMALNAEHDQDLQVIDAGHLFAYNTTYLLCKRSQFLRGYMLDFIAQFAPHLTPALIDQARACQSQEEITALFNGFKLKVR